MAARQYKLLLEVLPVWVLGLFYASFFISFLLLGVLVGFFGPKTYIEMEKPVPFDPNNPLLDFAGTVTGNDTVQVKLNDVDRFNGEIYFWVRFYPNTDLTNFTGFQQSLKLKISLWGSHDVNADDDNYYDDYVDESMFTRLTPVDNMPVRKLLCKQHQSACEPVYLFHEQFVQYKVYLVNIRILDQGQQASLGFYDAKLDFGFTFGNNYYSYFEIAYRYILSMSTFSVLGMFILVTRAMQPFSFWHTEQRWMVVLLLTLIFFNNPLYILHFLSTNMLFTLMNGVFKGTFVCALLFSLLVFTHSMFTKQKDRSIFSFYLPKVILIVAIWCASVLTFTYNAYKVVKDPTYEIKDESLRFKLVMSFSYVLMISYAFWLFYYITRAIGMMHLMPEKYSTKFRVVWGMAVVVLVLSSLVYMLLSYTGLFNSSVFFLSFYILFNFFIWLMALLFLPSSIPETVTKEDLEQESMLASEE